MGACIDNDAASTALTGLPCSLTSGYCNFVMFESWGVDWSHHMFCPVTCSVDCSGSGELFVYSQLSCGHGDPSTNLEKCEAATAVVSGYYETLDTGSEPCVEVQSPYFPPSESVPVLFNLGWSMFGITTYNTFDTTAFFSLVENYIVLVKDSEGMAYVPGIGDFMSNMEFGG